MSLAVVFIILHLYAEYVLGSSSPYRVQSNDVLSKPSTHVIGANLTTLIICRRGRSIYRPLADHRSLEVKCKGLRHRYSLERLTTVDDGVSSAYVTTSRMIVKPKDIKKFKHRIICYCVDALTKDKSGGLVISMKQASHTPETGSFEPKLDRKKTATLHSPVNMSWRFTSSPEVVNCLRDNKPLAKDKAIVSTNKSTVLIKKALRADAGFYYCCSKSGVFSSWFKLQVVGGWSRWRPWLPCTTQCGAGKKVDTRQCLETRRDRCRGPSIRALPCVAHCKGIVPEFVREPEDQVISNGSSTYITCLAQLGSNAFTVQLFCSSNGSKISYFLNKTDIGKTDNQTVRRKTYKIQLYRDSNDLAVVNCHCDTSTMEMSKRSRTAKISFISDPVYDVKTSSSASVLSTSPPLVTTTRDDVKQAKATPSLSSITNFRVKYAAMLATIIVITCLVLVLLIGWKVMIRRRSSTRSRNTSYVTVMPRAKGLCTSIKTERVTHIEPRDSTITKLHSGNLFIAHLNAQEEASDTPALISNHKDIGIPSGVRKFVEIPCKHETPIQRQASFTSNTYKCSSVSAANLDNCAWRQFKENDDGSVFRREGSCKSNTSNLSSVSATFLPKPKMPDTVDPELCAWGQFTEKGGRLTIQGTGVRLDIPFMALPKYTSQVIYIGMMNSKGNYPKLSGKEALLSPVVVCGPDGLIFDKPVYLTVPHNAVMDEKNSWSPQVRSCSTENDDKKNNEWKVIKRPEGDVPLSHVNDKYMQIMIEHFTNFAIVGVANSIEEASPQLKAWIVAFFTEPKVDLDCSVRIYCIPATDAAYMVVEGIESKVNGKTSDTPKLLRINNNDHGLLVRSKHIKEGWSAITGEEKFIPFEDIWQGIKESPNVSFVFERVSPNTFKFRSIFDVKQEFSSNSVEAQVMFSIQRGRTSTFSSGYSSQANGCEVDVMNKIPRETVCDLCFLLDPERTNDWRMLSEKLGCKTMYMNWLKGNEKIKSPTEELIEWWERTKSQEVSLQQLVKISEEMERHDVAEVLKQIPCLN